MNQVKQSFTFGKNWRRFLKSYTPERQQIAKDALMGFLKMKDLKDKTFLDIGSGSGIHSAAAFLAGAKRIHSFDYDPDSVAATRHLHEKFGSPAHWVVEQASVLDDAYMKQLGSFDIVYSWGVLHHTGDQWHAINNVMKLVGPRSRLFIALYAKEAFPDWLYWLDIKRRYNEVGSLGKLVMELHYVWKHAMGRKIANGAALLKRMWDYRQSRGMAYWSDVRDWLGGWPTEFSSVKEVNDLARNAYGLSLVNLGFGEANSEFLFMQKDYAESEGYTLMDEADLLYYLPLFNDEMPQTFSKPVWIFGAARGAEMVHAYLAASGASVAGFIDITPGQPTCCGLPILSFDEFVRQTDQDVPVILASKYVSPNWDKLRHAGFKNVINAFGWIQSRAMK